MHQSFAGLSVADSTVLIVLVKKAICCFELVWMVHRWYHLRLYESVFVGSEAVTWLVGSGSARTRPEAAALAQRLFEAHFFHHVVRRLCVYGSYVLCGHITIN